MPDVFGDQSPPTLSDVLETQEVIERRLNEIVDLVESRRGARQVSDKPFAATSDDVRRILCSR
ncbi:hypothetical protein [Lacipirellula parvula]|uniref:hypothetical protein n=1 Tax=Lacipirellula parvula TaxID=2650471 RepID=UPI00156252CE|nr:hypothetical protein [Lacipirellula parvula]